MRWFLPVFAHDMAAVLYVNICGISIAMNDISIIIIGSL